MAIQTVTGAGQGSAFKAGQKGSDSMYLGDHHIIGIRVVEAASATVASGTSVAVKFEKPLAGVASDYVVIATHQSATPAAVSVSAFTTAGFTLNGPNSATIGWIVVRVKSASVKVG